MKTKQSEVILYNGDNKEFLKKNFDLIKKNKEQLEIEKFKIIYFDPPYNTGNTFNYQDNFDKNEWFKEIEERLILIKNKNLLKKDGVIIFSISEESLLPSLILLNKHFKYVYPPFCWLTKSVLNQNKVNLVNSVVHEYLIVASENKIESNLEKLSDEDALNVLNEKYKNYPLQIFIKNEPTFINKDGKEYLSFTPNDFEIVNYFKLEENLKNDLLIKHELNIKILKEKYNINLEKQIFQKRTMQKGHGSERYYQHLISLNDFDKKNLYCLLNVKDKNNLNGKFLLNNHYFQSIQKENVKMKIPSFLGYYQPGVVGFQTAKPINLMKRIFKAFSNQYDYILDLYSGSGNVLKAGAEINRKMIGVEIDNGKSLEILKKSINNLFIIN